MLFGAPALAEAGTIYGGATPGATAGPGKARPIRSTTEMAQVAKKGYPLPVGPSPNSNQATHTFIALRLVVTREIENLGALLVKALRPDQFSGPKAMRSHWNRTISYENR
jgi:hypothetical protein